MIIKILLPLSLAFIMFSMGLELTIKDFKNVFKFPKAFTLGLLLQVVLLPIIAYGIISMLNLPSFLAIGLMIIACCPGGITSNYMTHISKGDTALSVSLTAIASILGIITIPFIVGFALNEFTPDGAQRFSIFKTAFGIFLMTTVPVTIGLIINKKCPLWSERNKGLIGKISSLLFGVLVVGAIAKEYKLLIEYFSQAGTATLLLNMLTMASAIVASKLFRLSRRQEIALTIECGFQNATLAMVISTTILQNTQYMVVSGVYGIIMLICAVFYFGLLKKKIL